jgi:AcrR family transcriptional regulator
LQAKKMAARRKAQEGAEWAGLPPPSRILYAAFDAFVRDGYAKTSMLAIATRARVSKRDLYANFSDKGAILAACIEGRAREMRQPLELAPPQTVAALRETLERFGTTALHAGTLPSTVAAFRLAIAEPDTDAAAVLDAAAREANRAALENFLAEARRRSLLGPGDPRVMAGQFLSLLWGDLLMRLLLRAGPAPATSEIERRAREATRILLLLHGTGGGGERVDGQERRGPR